MQSIATYMMLHVWMVHSVRCIEPKLPQSPKRSLHQGRYRWVFYLDVFQISDSQDMRRNRQRSQGTKKPFQHLQAETQALGAIIILYPIPIHTKTLVKPYDDVFQM